MIHQSPINKTTQFSLNSVPLRKLCTSEINNLDCFETLSEEESELILGAGKLTPLATDEFSVMDYNFSGIPWRDLPAR